jgi:pyruvoyl-dependent arginine decarboxylase (PvlArgDC)
MAAFLAERGLDGHHRGEHKPVSAAVKPGRSADARSFGMISDIMRRFPGADGMKELLRTNDNVLLSYAAALLRDAGIEAVQLDTHTSVLEGSIGAIPRRLMVADADHAAAQALIDQAMADVAASVAAEETPE